MTKYAEKLRNIIRLLPDEDIKKIQHYVKLEYESRGLR